MLIQVKIRPKRRSGPGRENKFREEAKRRGPKGREA